MSTLTGQKRPGTANASPIEGTAVVVLAIAVAVVTVPAGTLWKFCAQQRVDHFEGVQDSGIVRSAQAEADKGQRIGTDDLRGTHSPLTRGAVLDGNEALQGRGRTVTIGRDTDVISFDVELAREIAIDGVGPALDVVVPGVGCVAQVSGRHEFA